MYDRNELSLKFQTQDRPQRPNHDNKDGFIPCPFCGATPHIRIEDDEGNCHDFEAEYYEKDPWSGLWYAIEHTRDPEKRGKKEWLKNTADIPHDIPCPIATDDFQILGFGSVPAIGGYNNVFETRKEAVEWWNKTIACAYQNLKYMSKRWKEIRN